VLRHRRLLSTAIYAKTDVPALRALARPWPAGAAKARSRLSAQLSLLWRRLAKQP
jgi:hypothetical protein